MASKVLMPAKGLKVRNPKTGKHLSIEGEKVELNKYWLRRLSAGDVFEKKEKISTETKYKKDRGDK